jgi:transcriptional regulator with XRE-family HTH domain
MTRNKKLYSFDWQVFSEQMKIARQGRGLSQTQLGDAIGKSKATISKYEHMKAFPPVWDFLAICYYFDWQPLKFLLVYDGFQKTVEMFDASISSRNLPKGANGD